MEMVCRPDSREAGRWARRLAASGLVVPLAFGFAGVLTLSMLAGRARPDVALLAALVVHASYRLDALADLVLEPLASARSRGLAGWRGWAALDGLAAFAAAAWLATTLHSTLAAALLAVFPLSVAFYGLPLLGRLGLRWDCVKDIPHAKAAYTAVFWGVLAVYAGWLCGASPVLLAGGFVLFALRLLVNTQFCDLKDIERDRVAGVPTLAVRLGREGLVRHLRWLNLALLPALAALIGLGALPPAAGALALTTLSADALLGAARRRLIDDELLCNLWADAEWLAWPVLVWLAA